MNSVKQSLASDSGLAAYVEEQLEDGLAGLPMIWTLGSAGLTLQRVVSRGGRWAWRRSVQRQLAWYIYAVPNPEVPMPETVDLYYDLLVSRDLQAFLLTHSSVNAGLADAGWLMRNAKYIPFSALTNEQSFFRSKPLSLAQLVADTCLSCQPNLDWPT